MRFRTLSLTRFGHFTDRNFDFGPGADRPDFHIIYGPNEAGKTTTMEGALRLLYGFRPKSEPYDFRHQRSNLRIDASLEIAGTLQHFTRLSTAKASLVDAHGTALPEPTLASCLGGLRLEDYRNLLCLDDETLEEGGEEIARARGDIGTLLFSAAAGIADLSVVLDDLRKQADDIWRVRASKTVIADLKRRISDLDGEIRNHDVAANAWKSLRKSVADAQSLEARSQDHRRTLTAHHARLAGQRRALPMLAELTRLEAEIAQFPDCPAQLGFDPESLIGLMAEDQQHRRDIARLAETIADQRAKLAGTSHIPLPSGFTEGLVALAAAFLRDTQAEHQTSHWQTQATQAHATIARLSAELGLDPTMFDRLGPPDARAMTHLATARDTLREARSALPEAMRAVSACEAQANAHHAPDMPDLGPILSRHDATRLAERYSHARLSMRDAERNYRAALADLARPGREFASLPPCPHTHAQSRVLAEQASSLAEEQRRLREQSDQLQAEIATRTTRAAHLITTHSLLSDAEAANLRTRRDALWLAHLQTLTPGSAEEFHTVARACDQASDARLAQAATLGQLRSLEAQQAESHTLAEQLSIRRTRLEAELADLQGRLAVVTQQAGVEPDILPTEWADWVARHDKAARSYRAFEAATADHRETLEHAETLRQLLAEALPECNGTFDTLFAEASKLAQAQDQHRSEHARLAATLAQARDTLASRQHALHAAEQDFQAALAFFPGVAPFAETWLTSLTPLQHMLEAAAQIRTTNVECARIATERAQFARDVSHLGRMVSLPPAETPAASYEALQAYADAQTRAAQQLRDQQTTIDSATRDLQQHEDQRAAIAQHTALLGREFAPETPTTTLAELRNAALRAQTVIAARAAHASQTQALLQELALPDLGTARAQLADLDPALLEAESAGLSADLEAAATECTQATVARVAAAQALARVSGSADVAALIEHRATLELEMEEAARTHLALHLGHLAASEAILRYRNSHRSGMMRATERCFVALTDGAYQGLETQIAGTQEILLARNAAGLVKQVDTLSKGTRFQLYLALRAAAYEQLVEQGLRLPFFCDDIFETFDENRTRAACRVMEQIGRSGQAIYLTHHRHVVDIARAVCDVPPVVHEIG